MSDGQAPSASLICERLKLERDRLKLGQAAVAGIAEVAVKTVGRWEREIPIPSDKLSLLARFGFDPLYIVTGERSLATLSLDESELLECFRAAPLAVKAATLAGLKAGAQPSERQASNTQIVTGSGNKVAGRDFHGKE